MFVSHIIFETEHFNADCYREFSTHRALINIILIKINISDPANLSYVKQYNKLQSGEIVKKTASILYIFDDFNKHFESITWL